MRKDRGYTLIELMVTMVIATVIMGTAAFNFKELGSPVNDGAIQLAGLLRKARAKALASTLAYTISARSSTEVMAEFSTNCAAARTEDVALALALPSGASLSDTSWSICFSSRGLSNDSADIEIREGASARTVQVTLGGGVRIL